MRFKRKVFLEKGHLVDIAPLIDIVFLLLIFFMLTSSFVLQPGIRVSLPKAVTSEVLQRDLVVVTITEKGGMFVNERPITRDELVGCVNVAANSNKPLLIRADKNTDLGKVIEVWDICREANVKQINIATTQ